jgi:hypothetical protein
METLQLTIPALYGDHHTAAIRSILEKMEGVENSFVSSAFHQVVIQYNAEKLTDEAIKDALAKEGYVEGTLEVVFPTGPAERSTRHSAAVAETHTFVEQRLPWEGRPLWPCPGFQYPAQKVQE